MSTASGAAIPSPAEPVVPALPEGYTARPATATDAAVAHGLVVAHHRASGGREAPPLEEVVADLAFPSLDRERDTWLVRDAQGRPVLYGIVYCDRPGRTFFDLFVDPELPRAQRRLLATAVGEAALVRVREDARDRGLDVTIAESGMVVTDDLLPEVLGALGLAPARLWWRMSADADTIRAAEPHAPAGFHVVRSDLDDDRVLRRVMDLDDETFREHYGYLPNEWATYQEEVRHCAGYDPTALWIVVETATGTEAGFLIGNDSRAEHGAGFVDTLGVRARYRGRGLAGLLLQTAFAEYAGRGRTSVALSVDTENATGAVGVYERVGMRPLDTTQSWERELSVRRAS